MVTVIDGMIPETRLCTGNLLDVLESAAGARERLPEVFRRHLENGCGVCKVAEVAAIGKNLKPEDLPTIALAFTYDDLARHWALNAVTGMRPCPNCERRFPMTEYMMGEICRFCGAVRAASWSNRP